MGEQRSNGSERGNTDSGEAGEQYLFDKRKRMDNERRQTVGTNPGANKSQKRGNTEYLEEGKRSKRRKYTLVGEQWGVEKGTSGLERKVDDDDGTGSYSGTGPLPSSGPGQKSTTKAMGELEREGPLLEHLSKEGEQTGAALGLGLGDDEERAGGNTSTGPLEPLPTKGPLLEPVTSEVKNTMNTMDPDDRGKGDRSVASKDVGNTDDASLLDTASTVLRLREDRGECVIKRGWCVKHDLKANKITQKKSVWTKTKTGLYKYCTRKLSVWRCDESMPTYVGTMRPREGAGVTTGSGG